MSGFSRSEFVSNLRQLAEQFELRRLWPIPTGEVILQIFPYSPEEYLSVCRAFGVDSTVDVTPFRGFIARVPDCGPTYVYVTNPDEDAGEPINRGRDKAGRDWLTVDSDGLPDEWLRPGYVPPEPGWHLRGESH